MDHRDFKVFFSALAGLARQDLVTYIWFFARPLSIPFRERRLQRCGVLSAACRRGNGREGVPEAYKDVSEVVDRADDARLARKVAWLEPMMCVKG
ncbi:MAG: RtcB family protein [Nitrospira sp.]|nr:RtcB family protein [Nitrospira sp.]MDH4249956.1 RtcB family protein [Nitrospira sp.]MDH4343438.1 RtcB family protein [Nitrospira sp.]MDH5336982.1 RtcB family protein [Nitrospira sp.]